MQEMPQVTAVLVGALLFCRRVPARRRPVQPPAKRAPQIRKRAGRSPGRCRTAEQRLPLPEGCLTATEPVGVERAITHIEYEVTLFTRALAGF